MENLEELTLTELKEIAKEKEIKNISKLKKEELIELLSNNSKIDNTEEINERPSSKIYYWILKNNSRL